MQAGRISCRAIIAFAVLTAVVACSPEPIKTTPPLTVNDQPKPSVPGTRDPVILSYCYSSQLNWSNEVLSAAREACPNGRLHFQGEDVLWTRCPLFQPVRATFLCYLPEAPQPKQSLIQ